MEWVLDRVVAGRVVLPAARLGLTADLLVAGQFALTVPDCPRDHYNAHHEHDHGHDPANGHDDDDDDDDADDDDGNWLRRG